MRWIPCGPAGHDVLVNPAHVIAMRTAKRFEDAGRGWRHRVELVMTDGSTVLHSEHDHPAQAQNKLYEIAEYVRHGPRPGDT